MTDGLAPTPAESSVELADLRDRAEVARRETRRRTVRAVGVTLVGPINFFVQSLIFWSDGWPEAGPVVFILMTLLAAGFWVHWMTAASASRSLAEDLGSAEAEAERIR